MQIVKSEHHITTGSDKSPNEATGHRASSPHKSALDKLELSISARLSKRAQECGEGMLLRATTARKAAENI